MDPQRVRPRVQAAARERRLKGLWVRFDSRPTEMFFSIVTFFWGFWLLMPFDTFSKSPNFRVLAWVAPEPVWGLFALGVAFLRVYGVESDCRDCRMGAATLGFCLWTFVSASIALTDYTSTGVPVYAAYAAINVMIALRIRWGVGAGEP